jgi:hypothetical protein
VFEMTDMFWLHVPLQTDRDEWLEAKGYEQFDVFGQPTKLIQFNLEMAPLTLDFTNSVIRQALLFSPMAEAKARTTFQELRNRLPVLAYRRNATIRIPEMELLFSEPDHEGRYDFRRPTLIPAGFPPKPSGAGGKITSHDDAATLFRMLADCPQVSDERLLAAIDLMSTVRYETLRRSAFLTYLTILDSLAERSERDAGVVAWLEEKIIEAKEFNDQSLITAIGNLKQSSHGLAIRELILRAENALGTDEQETRTRQSRAGAAAWYGGPHSILTLGSARSDRNEPRCQVRS